MGNHRRVFGSFLLCVLLGGIFSSIWGYANEQSDKKQCPDAALLSRDLRHASIDSQELLEIIRRIDNGNVQGARSLADSYLDAQIQLVDQLSKAAGSDDEKYKASEIMKRVNEYRAAHMTVRTN